jgi:hypothetical protein
VVFAAGFTAFVASLVLVVSGRVRLTGRFFVDLVLTGAGIAVLFLGVLWGARYLRRQGMGGQDQPSSLTLRDALMGFASVGFGSLMLAWLPSLIKSGKDEAWLPWVVGLGGLLLVVNAVRELIAYVRGR